MTREDEACLNLGREVMRMIIDIRAVTTTEHAYARRRFTFTGGEVYVLIANDAVVADHMEHAAEAQFDVVTVRPPSEEESV
jgi:hypothetical protein